MEGWTYDGPFDDLPAQQQKGGFVPIELKNHITRPAVNSAQAHRVILWKDVGDAEGTGLVHIAPGCGAEDFHLGKEFGLPVVAPIDENGVFIENFGAFSGMSAFDVAPTRHRIVEAKRVSLSLRRLHASLSDVLAMQDRVAVPLGR